jgi:hypothetical protein
LRAPPLRRFTKVKIDLQREQLVRRTLPRDWTPEPENPAPGDAAWHTPKTVRQIHQQEPFVHAVLREHLPRDVAASVIKHQRGVAAIARTAIGLQRELRRTEAAQIAKDERRRRKRRAINARGEAKGGPLYAETARNMVLQRRVDDIARLDRELTAKQLRELTTITNKYKRILPTIRNHGRRYFKRAADGVLAQRSVARWVHDSDDYNYNTTAASKWEYILKSRSFKYNEGRLPTDTTPAVEVAYGVRRAVDPYTKLLAARRLARDNNPPNKEAALPNTHQTRSLSAKTESQTQRWSVSVAGSDPWDDSSDEGDGDAEGWAQLTQINSDDYNDWGLS